MHWKAPLAGPSSCATVSAIQEMKPPSGDDAVPRTRFVGVAADGLVGFEMRVAFDGRPRGPRRSRSSCMLT
jgi:hypothetical protein